jgi:acetate kinase
MGVLVINAGSSSLKFKLFDGDAGNVIFKGQYLEIGATAGRMESVRRTTDRGMEELKTMPVKDHKSAIMDMFGLLRGRGGNRVDSDITVVGHRIVHGGERYSRAVLVSPEAIDYLTGISVLAPLHNPIGLSCVEAVREALAGTPQYAVFDTAFHKTMPENIFLYGLPLELYKKYGIRKYGFHGTSHKFAAQRAAVILGIDIDRLNIITCHLGNGQSLCAVKQGKSLDTSMGFTPLEGLPMGTRSGSFDPEIIFFLMKNGYAPDAIKTLINMRSGLLGLSGIDSHYKTIEEKAKGGDEDAIRASDVLINRITCLIGSYTAEMGGADAIVFTGGIGENSAYLRKRVLDSFRYAGLDLDDRANEMNAAKITAPGSSIQALVIPADEELQIAREVLQAMREDRGLQEA